MGGLFQAKWVENDRGCWRSAIKAQSDTVFTLLLEPDAIYSKLPALSFHKCFEVYARNLEVNANVWNLCGIRLRR